MNVIRACLNPDKLQNGCRIVIVGANFAGLTTAINLPRNYKTTVIDGRPHFEFLPNIHELLSGVKKAKSLRLNRKRLIERAGHRFVLDSVTTIDPEKKRIYTSGRKKLPYDICVVATGGVNNTLGISGAAKYGMPFKTVAHCQEIGRSLKKLIRRDGPVSIVIVGGGLEGVEALGEILRRYRRNPHLEVHLVEKNSGLLNRVPAGVGRDLMKICKAFNVHFHTATGVTKLAKDKVWLSSRETIKSDATIWTGGAVPPRLLRRSGLTRKAGEWVAVNGYLQSKLFDSVFVAGDAAEVQELTSKQAYHAMDMGEVVAANIKSQLAGQDLETLRPSSKPKIISFGDIQTYVVLGSFAVASPLLAGLKEGVFQAVMTKFDPPRGISSVVNLYGRTSESLFNLTLPSLMSMFSLKQLTNLRFLT
jgi:NADH dehydrogenase